VVLCGLILGQTPLGESWINASYDYLFRFESHFVPSNVILVVMDNAAFDQFHQQRGQPWDRSLHARLLNKFADDGCAMVVMDSFFQNPRDRETDAALAAAMGRQRKIVLMAAQAEVTHPDLIGAQPLLPCQPFLSAVRTNWGVAWLDPDLDMIVRRHWPFPSPGPYPSLSETAAKLQGATRQHQLPETRWLRYYSQDSPVRKLSYGFALTQPTGYFRDKIIFLGTEPKTSLVNGEEDKFNTPFTRWTGEATGGIEIITTSFLNLLNGDWLRRPAPWIELWGILGAGILFGGGICRMNFLPALSVSFLSAAVIGLALISLSFFSNYWVPWLVVVGGQIPCALAWTAILKINASHKTSKNAREVKPKIPGYRLFHPPFGEGAYGKVWLARAANQQWRAVKVVYLAKFDDNADPFHREFEGISRYQPISHRHPGLLQVDFISKKLDGYFYYVMELGDSLEPGWQNQPSKYQAHDLLNECKRAKKYRLPVPECIRLGLALTDALEFIHQQGLAHRDIKPQNIIFVGGQPKLADLGLISQMRSADEIKTFIGTPGYMPPPPEPPGTFSADIYALGMVLYTISTGRSALVFPEIATTLIDTEMPADFLKLNTIILKACHANPANRYHSALEMHQALMEIQK
jgi:CHASE2 domain-containing sensor protein